MTARRPTGISVAPPTRSPAGLVPTTGGRPLAFDRTRSDVALTLLVATIVLVPVTVGRVPWSAPGGEDDFNRRITLQLFDFALVLMGCMRIAALAARPRSPRSARTSAAGLTGTRDPLTWSLAAMAAFGIVALTIHPSPRGVELAARVVLGALVVHAFVDAPAQWLRRLCAAIVVTASLQAVVAVAQSANGAILGWRWLEFDGPLYPFGSSYAGRGGLTHPYHLAVLLEVGVAAAVVALRAAPRRAPWLVAIATCSAGLGVTYSRAAAIGIAAAIVALLWPRRHPQPDPARRVYAMAAGALLAGAAATGLTMGDGWTSRTSASANVGSADSGRVERAREAIDLVGDNPVVGVGPGRYVIALAERGDAAPLPAHNVVLHVAAEAGVPAGLAVALVGILLARRYLTSSRESAAAFVLLVPYFTFDAYPYVFPVGLFLTAVWLGLLERARER